MMVVIVAGVGDHLADWHYASVDNFAVGMFELDGGVMDVKFLFGQSIDLEKDAVAFGRGNVIDLNVAGEGMAL